MAYRTRNSSTMLGLAAFLVMVSSPFPEYEEQLMKKGRLTLLLAFCLFYPLYQVDLLPRD
jgi:hypothetical protein